MAERRVCEHCGTVLKQYSGRLVCPSCLLRGGLPVEQERASGEKPSPASASRSLPHSFGDYELLEVIARGGMGIVYRARQRSLNRVVAIKMLQGGEFAQPKSIERFRAEEEAVAQLHHPNIVAIHEIGEQDGQPFFSMDYVEGKDLAQVSAGFRVRSAEFRRCAGWLETMAEAVHYAHERGIIHRDLKPSNVLIDAFDQPWITDFGLAKRLSGTTDYGPRTTGLTLTGQVLGSPNYLPPEQAAGKPAGVGSDVYSLGAILYHLLTGRPPFEAESLTTLLRQVVEAEPVSPRLLNPGIPRDLETICLKCLEKERSHRYATTLELAEDLGRFLDDKPVQARPVTALGKGLKWCQRRPALAGMGGALALALVLGSTGVLGEWRRAATGELLARQNAQAEARQRQRAQSSEYAADMHLAQLALADHNRPLTLSLLDKYRPKSAQPSTLNHQLSTDLRGWEWRYLWQVCQGDELSTLHKYPGSISALTVSPDGKLLAVATMNQIVLWDPNTKQPLTVVSNGVGAPLAFAVTGDLLAMGSRDAAGQPGVALWDVKARKVLKTLACDAAIKSLAISPDGTLLATFDKWGNVKVVDWASDRVLTNLIVSQPRYAPAGVVAFSPDGSRLAIGEDYGRIRLLELQTRKLLPLSTNYGYGVTALAFSPNSSLLAAGYGYGSGLIRLWDAVSREPRGQLTNHTGNVTGLAFTPDGRRLASASSDWTIRVWDVRNQSELSSLSSSREGLTALAILPEGNRLVSGGSGGSVCFWDAAASHRGASYTNLAVAEDFASFAEVDAPGFTRGKLDPRVVRRFGFVFTPDSRHFITLDTNGSLLLGDAQSLRLVESLPVYGRNHWALALSPDEHWLATGDQSGSITLWDWKNQHSVTNVTAPFEFFGSLHFSRSGHYLITSLCFNNNTVGAKIWRTSDWAEVLLPGGQSETPWSVELSPDDRVLAVGYDNGAVKLFRFPSLEESQPPLIRHEGPVPWVLFSPDARELVSVGFDGCVQLRNVVARQEEVQAWRAHLDLAFGAALSPDGRRLATGGSSGNDAVKLWDLGARREVLSLSCERLWFYHLSFSPDGNVLAATSLSGITHLWRVPSWEEIAASEKGKEIP